MDCFTTNKNTGATPPGSSSLLSSYFDDMLTVSPPSSSSQYTIDNKRSCDYNSMLGSFELRDALASDVPVTVLHDYISSSQSQLSSTQSQLSGQNEDVKQQILLNDLLRYVNSHHPQAQATGVAASNSLTAGQPVTAFQQPTMNSVLTTAPVLNRTEPAWEEVILSSDLNSIIPMKSVPTTAMPEDAASAPGLSSSLYVRNLPPDANELFLYQRFSRYGAILSARVHADPVTGRCRGVGFINFSNQADALRAMHGLHGTRTPSGHKLHIALQAPRAVRAIASVASCIVPSVAPTNTLQQLAALGLA